MLSTDTETAQAIASLAKETRKNVRRLKVVAAMLAVLLLAQTVRLGAGIWNRYLKNNAAPKVTRIEAMVSQKIHHVTFPVSFDEATRTLKSAASRMDCSILAASCSSLPGAKAASHLAISSSGSFSSFLAIPADPIGPTPTRKPAKKAA